MARRAPLVLTVVASAAFLLALAVLAAHRATPQIFTDVGPMPDSSPAVALLGGVAVTTALVALAMTIATGRGAIAPAVAAGCIVLAVGLFTAMSDERLVRWESARACVERGQGFWCLDRNDPRWRADAVDPGPLARGGAAVATTVQYAELAAAGLLVIAAVVGLVVGRRSSTPPTGQA